MSVDYALFKQNSGFKITSGLAYLLLCGRVDCIELQRIDVDEIRNEISTAFPGVFDQRKADVFFQCELTSQGIILETHSNTPDSVIGWFQAFAQKKGMKFFDPQSEKITRKDEKECQKRILDAEKDDELLRISQQIPELTSRAQDGDAHALFLLGNRYCFGEGVPVDKLKAFTCYEASAKAGDPDGMFNLAACFRFGDGVRKDIHRAIEWYQRATEVDKIFAPFALGEIYKNGEGVPIDTQKAIEYFLLARNNGNQDAFKPLRELGALPPLKK
jgi:Sel1 repeat